MTLRDKKVAAVAAVDEVATQAQRAQAAVTAEPVDMRAAALCLDALVDALPDAQTALAALQAVLEAEGREAV